MNINRNPRIQYKTKAGFILSVFVALPYSKLQIILLPISVFYMRLYLCCMLLLTSCATTFRIVNHPTNYSTYIRKGKMEGVLFLASADCFGCGKYLRRFSPTMADINTAEQILSSRLEAFNNPMFNQARGCPIIHKNLKQYRRQYIGYLDTTGNRMLFVTFNWNRYTLFDRIKGYAKHDPIRWKKDIEYVLDGCSYHWSIHVNLTTLNLADLSINGGG